MPIYSTYIELHTCILFYGKFVCADMLDILGLLYVDITMLFQSRPIYICMHVMMYFKAKLLNYYWLFFVFQISCLQSYSGPSEGQLQLCPGMQQLL